MDTLNHYNSIFVIDAESSPCVFEEITFCLDISNIVSYDDIIEEAYIAFEKRFPASIYPDKVLNNIYILDQFTDKLQPLHETYEKI